MNLMKKVVVLLLALFLVASSVFAQQQAQQQEEKAFPQRLGLYFSYAPTVGALREYVSSSIGGGFAYSFGFSLPLGLELGPVAHLSYNGNPVKNDKIVSMTSLEFDIGVYLYVPFGKSGFSFCPEFDYGMLAYFPKANTEYTNASSIKMAYVDQLFQVGAGFRFSHQKFLNGKMEIELTPTYVFSLEKGETIHFIGFRTGFLYRVDKNANSQKQAGGEQ